MFTNNKRLTDNGLMSNIILKGRALPITLLKSQPCSDKAGSLLVTAQDFFVYCVVNFGRRLNLAVNFAVDFAVQIPKCRIAKCGFGFRRGGFLWFGMSEFLETFIRRNVRELLFRRVSIKLSKVIHNKDILAELKKMSTPILRLLFS